jgi:hypothetical protein
VPLDHSFALSCALQFSKPMGMKAAAEQGLEAAQDPLKDKLKDLGETDSDDDAPTRAARSPGSTPHPPAPPPPVLPNPVKTKLDETKRELRTKLQSGWVVTWGPKPTIRASGNSLTDLLRGETQIASPLSSVNECGNCRIVCERTNELWTQIGATRCRLQG